MVAPADMKWAHSGGLGSDLVLREEAVELMPELRDAFPAVANITKLEVDFVFDRQARPHLILICDQLTDESLGLGRKPSYWDLPVELQASLLELQNRVVVELSALRSEVHLGSWVSSKHIHAHVVMPLLPYFAIRAASLKAACYDLADAERRARYVEKRARDNIKFKNMDGLATQRATLSGKPQRKPNEKSFEALSFDPEESGMAVIDMTFKGAPRIKSMPHAELCEALVAIRGLCDALSLEGAHLLFPAPALGDATQLTCVPQERVARLVVRPDLFVLGLPPQRRQAWYEMWIQADHRHSPAYKEDFALLPQPPAGGEPSLVAKSEPPQVVYKRKLCRNFKAPSGCRYGDRCLFLHE